MEYLRPLVILEGRNRTLGIDWRQARDCNRNWLFHEGSRPNNESYWCIRWLNFESEGSNCNGIYALCVSWKWVNLVHTKLLRKVGDGQSLDRDRVSYSGHIGTYRDVVSTFPLITLDYPSSSRPLVHHTTMTVYCDYKWSPKWLRNERPLWLQTVKFIRLKRLKSIETIKSKVHRDYKE